MTQKLEEENEKLKEEVGDLKDKVAELQNDLEWYECDCSCECGADRMEKELVKIASVVLRWHDSSHSGAYRWCEQEPCNEVRELTYGY